MINKKSVRYATTLMLTRICKDSEGRNRGPNKAFYKHVDPGGVHVCCFTMLHNEDEIRTMWLCKMTVKTFWRGP